MADNGVIIFAHNNDSSERDYLFSAWTCAKTIKNQSPNIPVSLFTRSKDYVEPQHIDIYDHILEFPFGDAGHEDNNTLTNFYQIYYTTPYEQTLVLDADTLVLGKLDGLFAAARRHNLLFPHTIKDFRNVEHSVNNKLAEKNNLPNFETSIWYFSKDFNKEKSLLYGDKEQADKIAKGEIKIKEDTEPFFNLLESYLRNHNIVYEQFKHDRPAEYDKDFLFSTTVDNLDLIDDVLDYNILTYTDLSAIDNEWYKNLNYWIKDGKLKIENYNVTGIIHYGKHAFNYGELDQLARQWQF
tara:strand:+ start:341 stop:1231 length:891 start_codon:yes stop_codon:yes gene_type:complete